MGRKLNYEDKVKKGPGRKSRKQSEPELKTFFNKDSIKKNLSHRQLTRVRKRKQKEQKEIEKSLKAKNKNNLKALNKKNLKKQDESSSGEEWESAEDSGAIESFNRKDEIAENEMEYEDEELEKNETKNKLFGDDDSSSINGDSEFEMGDSGNESDIEENDCAFAKIEKQSSKLDQEMAKIDDENLAELKRQSVSTDIPSLQEVKEELKTNPDIQEISLRIKDVVYVLSKFRERREENRSRSEYLAILEEDLGAFYSYNKFLIKKLMELFPIGELIDFLEANEVPRPITIRTNTLKTRRKVLAQTLINSGVNLDVISWSKVGLVIYSASSVPLGATSEYLCGHYILQGASSFLPVVALAAKENEKILDMCAAPGGKSTHIAAMMRNTGVLIANDANKDRTKSLIGNLHRLGVSNAVITNCDGRKFSKLMPKHFDRVLLDAPCSGTGVISKDQQVKNNKGIADIQRCSVLQKELILSAIDSVDANSSTGGYVCYSTCSILSEENEDVINYAINKRNVKLVPTGLEIGQVGIANFRGKTYHKSMNLCKRIYPHKNNMDGFFVAKLKKLSNDLPVQQKKPAEETESEEEQETPTDVKKRKRFERKMKNTSLSKRSKLENTSIQKKRSKLENTSIQKKRSKLENTSIQKKNVNKSNVKLSNTKSSSVKHGTDVKIDQTKAKTLNDNLGTKKSKINKKILKNNKRVLEKKIMKKTSKLVKKNKDGRSQKRKK